MLSATARMDPWRPMGVRTRKANLRFGPPACKHASADAVWRDHMCQTVTLSIVTQYQVRCPPQPRRSRRTRPPPMGRTCTMRPPTWRCRRARHPPASFPYAVYRARTQPLPLHGRHDHIRSACVRRPRRDPRPVSLTLSLSLPIGGRPCGWASR